MSFVESFTHLKNKPRSDRALALLQKVASLVKPIMRKHGWRLPVLSEFFPDSDNLVGLNVNGGEKIMLRLRPAWAPDTFYDEDQLVGVMLHELTHNVHGPHDEKFYNFLAGLEDEYEALKRSGYAGEGFHSKGNRLGAGKSHNISPHLLRSKAVEAAEKRKAVGIMMAGGGRLGGRVPGGHVKAMSPRELAARAAERRARDEKSCGTGGSVEAKNREADKAAKDSVVEKAAVIDLTLDDETETSNPELIILEGPGSDASRGNSNGDRRFNNSNGLTNSEPQKQMGRETAHSISFLSSATREPVLAVKSPSTSDWACHACTLLNPPLALQCSACLSNRPLDNIENWSCWTCGEAGMPHNLWSCRFCGAIKRESVIG